MILESDVKEMEQISMEKRGFLRLRITGHNLNHKEITSKLNQKPSFLYHEGESYIPEYGDKKAIIYKEDCWLLEIEKDETLTFDDAIFSLLAPYKKSAEFLYELSVTFNVTLWISVYPDQNISNIYLSSKTLKLLSDMGISINFTTSFLKGFYDETY